MENKKIEKIFVIAKLNDGNFHQVVIDSVTENIIYSAIYNFSGKKINLLENPINGLKAVENKK
jgi:hypothetical protein